MPSTSSARTLWALVDCNNFYAACERLFRPDLAGKPIVVLSGNDGCIVSRSAEARALGIGMGEPEFRARSMLKRHNAAVFSSNFKLYGDISNRVMLALESLAPLIEQYSIDEAFVPLSGSLAVNADELAWAMRERVRMWTGIFVSVGIGATRTLAKLAGELAKKGPGVFRLDAGSQATDAVLASAPAGDIWGIGRRSAEKLRLRSINTAKDLRDADNNMIKKLLGAGGLNTAMELRGIHCIDHADVPAARRTMVCSRSFGERVTKKKYLAEALALFAASAGERLRKEKLEAGGIQVHIRTARHGQGRFYDETAEVLFPSPTSSSPALIGAAREGLDRIFRQGFRYAKAGVMLFDLADQAGRQGSLMDIVKPDERKEKDRRLMSAVDALNRRFGRGAVRFAAEGEKDAPWRAKSAGKSPAYISSWDELPVVRG